MTLRKTIFFRPLDFLIFAIAIFLFAASIFLAGKKTGGEKYVSVRTCNGQYIFPLNKDTRQEIQGFAGISVIAIKNGEAFFEDSCCPNKTCVASAPVKEAGDWSACLPNQVFLRIDGNGEDAVDVFGK